MIKQKGSWVIKRRLVYVCVRVCDPGGGGFWMHLQWAQAGGPAPNHGGWPTGAQKIDFS